jgi:hypothetical protein
VISFRYHLVSIIAVFLALALGIVVGTTGLNGAILSDLRSNVKSQKADIAKLRTDNSTLQKQVNDDNNFAGDFSKQILAGTIGGQTVVLVSGPGASSNIRSGIKTAIATGGGTVTAQLQIQPDYVDPARGADITGLATGSARPVGLQLPETSDSTILGGALLGYVLAGRGTSTDLPKVVTSFSTLNMIKTEGSDQKPGKVAVVVTSGNLAKDDPKAKAMLSLVSQLNQNGLKTIVVGDSDSALLAGLVAQVRSDSVLSHAVSTVDNADTALGQVSAVLSIAALVASGSAGQYGTGPGASAVHPSTPK